jgi:hypothetical protein
MHVTNCFPYYPSLFVENDYQVPPRQKDSRGDCWIGYNGLKFKAMGAGFALLRRFEQDLFHVLRDPYGVAILVGIDGVAIFVADCTPKLHKKDGR